MRPIARYTLVAAAAMILAGCGSSGSSVPPLSSATTSPSIAAGATSSPSFASPSPSGPPDIHISVPADWQEVEITEDALTAQAEALEATNPLMAQAFRQFLTSGRSRTYQFYAIGYEGIKPVGIVVALTLSLGGVPLDAVLPVLEGQLKQVGATDIKLSHVRLQGVDAVVIDYGQKLKAPSAEVKISGRVYLIPVGQTVYDVTIGCFASNAASCLADGETMVEEMTIGPSASTPAPLSTLAPGGPAYALVVAASNDWLADHSVALEDKLRFAEEMRSKAAEADSVWEHLLAEDASFALNTTLALCEWMRTGVPLKEAADRVFAVSETQTDDYKEQGLFAGWMEGGAEGSFCPEYAKALVHLFE